MTNIIKKDKYSNKASAYFDRDIGPEKGEISAAHFKGEYSELDPDCEINFVFDCCYGGSVKDGFEIYKTIRGHQGPTTAHIQGICASIASVIAMGCDTIRMANNALFMIHDPHWSTSRSQAMCSTGNQKLISIPREYRRQQLITIPTLTDKNASVRRTLEENRRIIKTHKNRSTERKKLLAESKESILDIYVLRAGAGREDLRQMMAEETWFLAWDCIQFGFADFITQPTGLVDQVDFSRFASPTNFLSAKYLASAKTAKLKRLSKVNRKQTEFMRATVQKILTQRQQETTL